jgi:uncharacterized protein YbjT (DUF2867 family)
MHVVFGAGGALGASIVRNLAQQNKAVHAVVRDVGRARKVLPSSAEIVIADASKPDSNKPAFQMLQSFTIALMFLTINGQKSCL